MGMSKRTLETLIDLVEIKLSCMEVIDRDDAREFASLERCLGELKSAMRGVVVAFPGKGRLREQLDMSCRTGNEFL